MKYQSLVVWWASALGSQRILDIANSKGIWVLTTMLSDLGEGCCCCCCCCCCCWLSLGFIEVGTRKTIRDELVPPMVKRIVCGSLWTDVCVAEAMFKQRVTWRLRSEKRDLVLWFSYGHYLLPIVPKKFCSSQFLVPPFPQDAAYHGMIVLKLPWWLQGSIANWLEKVPDKPGFA